MDVATRLNAAADLIEREGWIQGKTSTKHGRCLVAAIFLADEIRAINRASINNISILDSQKAVRIFLSGGDNFILSAWNDEPERTADEVVAALRGAANQSEE